MSKQQQDVRRSDPEPRYTDATADWAELRNRDPGRFYVYVSKASDQFGPDYFEAMGYDVELKREGGPRPAVSGWRRLADGSTIEIRGHALMSVDVERKREIDRYGFGGNGGAARFDYFEQLFGKKLHERGSVTQTESSTEEK